MMKTSRRRRSTMQGERPAQQLNPDGIAADAQREQEGQTVEALAELLNASSLEAATEILSRVQTEEENEAHLSLDDPAVEHYLNLALTDVLRESGFAVQDGSLIVDPHGEITAHLDDVGEVKFGAQPEALAELVTLLESARDFIVLVGEVAEGLPNDGKQISNAMSFHGKVVVDPPLVHVTGLKLPASFAPEGDHPDTPGSDHTPTYDTYEAAVTLDSQGRITAVEAPMVLQIADGRPSFPLLQDGMMITEWQNQIAELGYVEAVEQGVQYPATVVAAMEAAQFESDDETDDHAPLVEADYGPDELRPGDPGYESVTVTAPKEKGEYETVMLDGSDGGPDPSDLDDRAA